MKNPVMNYNQFMSAFKKAESGYSKRANVNNGDAKADSKVNQEMSSEGTSGKKTPQIGKYTKEHLSNIKKKNIVNGK